MTILAICIAALATSCGGTAPGSVATTSPTPAEESDEGGRGGIAYVSLDEPIRLTVGTYESCHAYEECYEDEIQAAGEVEDALPWFRGTINGIHIRPGNERQRTCPGTLTKMTDAQREQYGLDTPTDLPPGTWVTEESFGTMCDGQPWYIGQGYDLNLGQDGIEFGTFREYQSDELNSVASAGRYQAGTIQGRPAVFVRPLHESGYGNSWIAFKDGDDLLIVAGGDLHFDDMLAIAQSLPI